MSSQLRYGIKFRLNLEIIKNNVIRFVYIPKYRVIIHRQLEIFFTWCIFLEIKECVSATKYWNWRGGKNSEMCFILHKSGFKVQNGRMIENICILVEYIFFQTSFQFCFCAVWALDSFHDITYYKHLRNFT